MKVNRKLYVSEQLVDIDPDETIEIVLESSIFDFDNLQGSYSSKFNLPYATSPRNRVVFNFMSEPGTLAPIRNFPFRLTFQDTLQFEGTLTAEAGEEISCTLIFFGGEIFNQLKDTLMLDWFKYRGAFSLPDETTAKNQTEYDDDVDNIAFAQLNDVELFQGLAWAYEDDENITQQVTQINWRSNIDGTMRTSSDDYQDGNDYYNYANCPQFFLKPLFKNIFLSYLPDDPLRPWSFNVVESFFDDSDFKDIALITPYDINSYGGTPSLSIGRWYDNSSINKMAYRALPNINVKDFILKIFSFFNASVTFNNRKQVFIKLNNDIIESQEAELLPKSFVLTDVESNDTDGYRLEFEIPSEDLFYENWIETSIHVIQELVNVDFNSNYLFGNPEVPGIQLLFGEEPTYIKEEGSDEIYGPNEYLIQLKGINTGLATPKVLIKYPYLQPIESGNKDYEVTVGATSIMRDFIGISTPTVNRSYEKFSYENIRLAYVRSGISTEPDVRNENTKLDLLFWEREKITGVSFFNKCWKTYLRWIQERKPVEATLNGEDAFLFIANYIAHKKYEDADGYRYLFREISFTLGSVNIENVTLKGWTVF